MLLWRHMLGVGCGGGSSTADDKAHVHLSTKSTSSAAVGYATAIKNYATAIKNVFQRV